MNQYYQLIGLDQSCSVDDIKSKYRELAKKLHPDHNKSPSAKTEFLNLQIAYEWLLKNHKQKPGKDKYIFFRTFNSDESAVFVLPKGFNEKDVLIKCNGAKHRYFNIFLPKAKIQTLPLTFDITNLKYPLRVTIREDCV